MKSGQTLTVLLVIVGIAIAIVGSAVAAISTNSQIGAKSVVGQQTLALAESGIEEALLQLLRNPSYVGETLTTPDGTSTITVTGANPKTITSTAVVSTFKRKVQVTATFSAGVLTVTSWKEIN